MEDGMDSNKMVVVSKEDWFYFVNIITYRNEAIENTETVAVCATAQNAYMIKNALADRMSRES